MESLVLLGAVLSLIAFDLLALRYGRDSRHAKGRDWW